jgi:hypothetical protein
MSIDEKMIGGDCCTVKTAKIWAKKHQKNKLNICWSVI